MLSQKYDEALVFASRLHARQKRKGTVIPYVSHLLAVSGLVLEQGASEEEAIGALLHDSIEDQGEGYPGGVEALCDAIRERFGEAVLAIVKGCTDGDHEVRKRLSYMERKGRYIEHITEASPSVRLVSCCDKTHNARAILADYRTLGEDLWGRFNGGRDGTLWYYRALVEAFQNTGSNAIIDELDRVVSEIERQAASVGQAMRGPDA